MRYFTREMYRQLQDDIDIPETEEQRDIRLDHARRNWERANASYLDYISSVRARLPESILGIEEASLHDAICISVCPLRGAIEIVLDTTYAPFSASRNGIRLRFEGVSATSGLDEAVGQAILYHEIFVEGAVYEFTALLERSDISIVAASMAIAPASG